MNTHQMFGLRRLVQHLRSLPDDKFNMPCWSQGKKPLDLNDCGTRACVGGWSTLFFDDLKLVRRSVAAFSTTTCDLEYQRECDDYPSEGYMAVAEAWGVSEDEATRLCSATKTYDSPRAAANEIDKLIEKYFIGKGDHSYVHGVN